MLTVTAQRTSALTEAERAAVIQLCIAAHGNPGFADLFSLLPPDGLHLLGHEDSTLVGHAVVTTRWLQPAGLPLLRTAYVDAVATLPARQGQGVGSAVMRALAAAVAEEYEIACLETQRAGFYARLGDLARTAGRTRPRRPDPHARPALGDDPPPAAHAGPRPRRAAHHRMPARADLVKRAYRKIYGTVESDCT